MENIDKIKQIIEGCLRKDRRSQEAFFKLYYGKMMSVCLRYISDRDSAQEVLQDGQGGHPPGGHRDEDDAGGGGPHRPRPRP